MIIPLNPMRIFFLALLSTGLAGAPIGAVPSGATPTGGGSLWQGGDPDAGGAPGLVRMTLFPAMERQGRGDAFLRWDPGPFGASVTRDGTTRVRIDLEISGLADPASIDDGRHRAYVLWATTPVLRPMLNLGEVGNGSWRGLGPVELDKFVLLVSAEPDADVAERTGPLVLRGMSPSNRMLPDNHLMVPTAGEGASGGDHGGHSGHGAADAEDGWPHPPMHPAVAMIPGLSDLRPAPLPFLPRAAPGEELALATPSRVTRMENGQTLDLVAERVRRTIHGREYVMYGFNGQYPGPLIHVDRESTIFVNFLNETEWPTAIHWHGIRLDNAFDGVPGVTQEPVPPGGTFSYRIHFPDAGLYWYHPHHREDVQQDLGLYGNMLVEAPPEEWFAPVHGEEILMLDDILVTDDGDLFPWGRDRATHALMGRFGNVMLVNGEPSWSLDVKRGEVIRFFLTNAANTRTFNLTFGEPGTHRIKVVASDLSKFERETFAPSVTLAPAERYIVEVRFDEPGEHRFENRVRPLEHAFGSFFRDVAELGVIRVSDEPAEAGIASGFDEPVAYPAVSADVDRFRDRFDDPPDHTLLMTLEVENLDPVVMQRMRADRVFFPPIEWAGTMPMMNAASSPAEARWILRDQATGRENMEIDWRYRVGDTVRIRLVNDAGSLHAMQHPFHIHGQRFLVVARGGVPNPNHAFKDTVLVGAGETVDLLLEITNPGKWMAHCHVAEHLEAGMRLVFVVDP